MSFNKNQNGDYKSLGSSKKNAGDSRRSSRGDAASRGAFDPQPNSRLKDISSLNKRSRENKSSGVPQSLLKSAKNASEKHFSGARAIFENEDKRTKPKESAEISQPKNLESKKSEDLLKIRNSAENEEKRLDRKSGEVEIDFQEKKKLEKVARRAEKDFELLKNENWLARNGHNLTYLGLFCFSFLVFYRPYELIASLGFLSATAVYFAAGTLLVYIPGQIAAEGNLTTFPLEVKCILALIILALLTMPIAKDPSLAWKEFNETFIKAALMFIVMVNVLRTRRRLLGLIWLSLSIGFVLSYMALGMYLRGEINVEGYRVAVEVGGMFGNPNELAMHLVTMLPLAVCLGFAAKNKFIRYFLYAAAALFVAAIVVTYSRGGFLGLLAVGAVLIWKLGKRQRAKIFAVSAFFGVLFILLAPGEYGQRIFSIFDSSLDSVGSSSQRTELLKRSIIVTLRNPWGIGIGNFPIVGVQNLVSHNAFTQVSSELGLTGLFAYMAFLISPFRKLGAIERRQPATAAASAQTNWFYFLSIGLQASIIGFVVTAFFASVAYNWFAYYLIAYAVAFRRIYIIEKGLDEKDLKADSLGENVFGWQIKSV